MGSRRASLVAHEEAEFSVKVNSWQQKINDEMGTDFEPNLNRIRRQSAVDLGMEGPLGIVELRSNDEEDAFQEDAMKTHERPGKVKRPVTSFGVKTILMAFTNRFQFQFFF